MPDEKKESAIQNPKSKILIVEDSAIQAEMLRRILVREGYEAVVAKDGAEGLEAAPKYKPDLILSDINMPVMDGFEMCSKIKQDAALRDIPLILLTQLYEPEEVLTGLESGADAYITKPYKEDYLLSMVRVTLENPRGFRNNPEQRSVEFDYQGKHYTVHSGRAQTLSFLISSYENSIMKNMELLKTQEQLKMLNEHLEDTVRERTAEVRESEKKYRDLVNNAAVGVYKSNLRGDILFMNQALAEMYEFESPEEVISAGALARYKNPEDRKKLLDSLLKNGRVDNFEADLVTKTGKVKHMLFNATLEGDVLSGMILDITEKKKLDEVLRDYTARLEKEVKSRTAQLEATNKELESFSYSVSHDLRAPLRAIDGFSGIILQDYKDKLDEEGKRLLNVVRDNTQKMGRLIDDILAFSRAGRKELELVEIDMEKLANEVIDELRPTTAGREVQFTVKTLPRALGDSAALKQVFVNLLSNAIKFTRQKDIAIIEIGTTDEGRTTHDELIYYVKDNGAGFDMQYANKLFGVFSRLHSAEEFEGAGIGLAIVKAFISKHGGRVWAEGKVNEGAIFYFSLPA